MFPNTAALLRLAGSVLIEQHDEWEAGERRYFSEASMLELAAMNNPIEVIDEAVILPELAAAYARTTDPHGVEKPHHLAGRDRAGIIAAVGRNTETLDRLAAWDSRVQPVPSVGDRAEDAAAITRALAGDADVTIDALGPAPTADLTIAGFDVLRPDGTMVLLEGVRRTLPLPYGDLMRRGSPCAAHG
ncbi:MAG: hypothetical protein JWP75_1037 [Frondihabitans sp.]|nr:hypothetical protein [Frondihabitans sp.]